MILLDFLSSLVPVFPLVFVLPGFLSAGVEAASPLPSLTADNLGWIALSKVNKPGACACAGLE